MAGDTSFPSCDFYKIDSYIDGQLTASDELELQLHISTCSSCSVELNRQKQFLCGLDNCLKNEGEMELPLNFTEILVATAENSVVGVRGLRERSNALFICAVLSLCLLVTMGTETGRAFSELWALIDGIVAVALFFGHLAYSVCLGIALILRSVGAQWHAELFVPFVLFFVARGVFSRRAFR